MRAHANRRALAISGTGLAVGLYFLLESHLARQYDLLLRTLAVAERVERMLIEHKERQRGCQTS